MKLKSIIVSVFAFAFCGTLFAQETANDSIVIANEDSCSISSIQSAIDACMLLAESADAKDVEGLRNAKEAMQKCGLADFGGLKPQDKTVKDSLEGHLVFNVAFADSLAEGKDPYKNADNINRSSTHRGQMEPGKILTKTCFIKANSKSVYSFGSRDRQELAIIAEPGGLVTTRVHATNPQKGINEWHNDTTDVTKGRSSRKTAFTLPHAPKSKVTLEITNCTNKDITVVVISN